jgi:cytochrome c1
MNLLRLLIIALLSCCMSSSFANSESIKRGENYFFSYCSACHSLNYAPTKAWTIAPKYLHKGKWQTALNQADATRWFGRMPPDLSLVVVQHSKSWLIRYLNGFYNDQKHPLGRNNTILNNVAMPDVLYGAGERRYEMTQDIANFLESLGYPELKTRYYIGIFAMGLCCFAIWLTWQLKKLYKLK